MAMLWSEHSGVCFATAQLPSVKNDVMIVPMCNPYAHNCIAKHPLITGFCVAWFFAVFTQMRLECWRELFDLQSERWGQSRWNGWRTAEKDTPTNLDKRRRKKPWEQYKQQVRRLSVVYYQPKTEYESPPHLLIETDPSYYPGFSTFLWPTS